MTTLADLPEKQRKEYIGMWCYLYDRICDDFGEPEPPTFEGIIAGYEGGEEAPARVLVRHPDPKAPLLEYEPCYVQPRFNLPRAWSPDGTPARGHTANLEEIADEYRNHCLAVGDDNTVAWIDRKRGELDAD